MGSKVWFRSRTIWAAIGVLVTQASGFAGDLSGLFEQLERLATAALALAAIWGRIKAETRIGGGS